MCLQTVKQANPKHGDLKREGVGWKVYSQSFGGKFQPAFRNWYGQNAVPGKDLIRSAHRVGRNGRRYYTAGFHIFVNQPDALECMIARPNRVVCRVRWRGLCATGTERVFNDETKTSIDREVLVVKKILSRRRVSKSNVPKNS